MTNRIKDRIIQNAEKLSEWERIFIRLKMRVSAQIINIIESNNYKRKTLADKLNKKESEISKWLSGDHNFTLKSLAKIEAELGEQFLFTKDEIIEFSKKDSLKKSKKRVITKN